MFKWHSQAACVALFLDPRAGPKGSTKSSNIRQWSRLFQYWRLSSRILHTDKSVRLYILLFLYVQMTFSGGLCCSILEPQSGTQESYFKYRQWWRIFRSRRLSLRYIYYTQSSTVGQLHCIYCIFVLQKKIWMLWTPKLRSVTFKEGSVGMATVFTNRRDAVSTKCCLFRVVIVELRHDL